MKIDEVAKRMEMFQIDYLPSTWGFDSELDPPKNRSGSFIRFPSDRHRR